MDDKLLQVLEEIRDNQKMQLKRQEEAPALRREQSAIVQKAGGPGGASARSRRKNSGKGRPVAQAAQSPGNRAADHHHSDCLFVLADLALMARVLRPLKPGLKKQQVARIQSS
jgi:hypothetical protein